MDVATFAQQLLRALHARDPRAVHLRVKARGGIATIGVDEGDTWVPLLRLSNASAAFNVMSLDVRQGRGWAPTFERGIPDRLAEVLLGELAFTWLPEVEAVLEWRGTSEHERPKVPR